MSFLPQFVFQAVCFAWINSKSFFASSNGLSASADCTSAIDAGGVSFLNPIATASCASFFSSLEMFRKRISARSRDGSVV